MEGWDGSSNRNDVHFSPDGEAWTEFPQLRGPHAAASVFVRPYSLWIVAGNNMTSDVLGGFARGDG